MSETLVLFMFLFAMTGWAMYFRADAARRDYLTDLSQAIHDGDLTREDLRRSLGHEPIEDRLERWGSRGDDR